MPQLCLLCLWCATDVALISSVSCGCVDILHPSAWLTTQIWSATGFPISSNNYKQFLATHITLPKSWPGYAWFGSPGRLHPKAQIECPRCEKSPAASCSHARASLRVLSQQVVWDTLIFSLGEWWFYQRKQCVQSNKLWLNEQKKWLNQWKIGT